MCVVRSDVFKTPRHRVVEGGTNIQNAKICCGLVRSGFRSSDRRQYSLSQLRDLEVSLLVVTGGH
jgi:hypothetical protein